MKLVIVSGLSGAGKTVALHSLEDMGAYCMDNLPVNLLPAIAAQLNRWQTAYSCVAVSIDARNIGLREVAGLLQTLKDSGVHYEILFLDASDEALIKRFSETRRKHPLSFQGVPLAEAIGRERELLEPLSSRADLHIDTTQLHLHQLRDLIRLRLKLQPSQGLTLLFESFGFKYGIPQDADFVFDARCLPNPHWDLRLRPLTGKDQPVIGFLREQSRVQEMLSDLIKFLDTWLPQFEADNRSYLTVAVGCTGGRHRSVYLTEQLAAHFRQRREGVLLRHRELL
jgi:UPF0042 nucleotide-binding protein